MILKHEEYFKGGFKEKFCGTRTVENELFRLVFVFMINEKTRGNNIITQKLTAIKRYYNAVLLPFNYF